MELVTKFPGSCTDADPFIELVKKLDFVQTHWKSGVLTRWEFLHLLLAAIDHFKELTKDVT